MHGVTQMHGVYFDMPFGCWLG